MAASSPLRPGRNAVTLSARDVAGHSASAAVTVTLSGTSTQRTLTPSERTMLVGETGTLSFRNEFGIAPTSPIWQTSNAAIVSLSTGNPPLLTAVAPGTVTISAFSGGLGAGATVTVVAGETLPSGEVRLPAGTVRWNVPTVTSSQSRRTAPIYAHRSEAGGPTVEPGGAFLPNATYAEYTVRALSEDGSVRWKEAAPGVPLMGDAYGAVVAGVPGDYRCAAYYDEDRFCYTALVRFGGTAAVAPWRYDSAGYLDRPAQGPDGTIYAIEHINGARNVGTLPDSGNNKSIVILDGSTGQVAARVSLPPYTSRTLSGIIYNEPRTLGPIVGSDGNAYVLAKRRDVDARATVIEDESWTLWRLSRTGAVSGVVVNHCQNASCNSLLDPRQLLPDGIGGLLITGQRWLGNQLGYEGRLIRFDAESVRTDHVWSSGTRIALVGQAGVAYLGSPVVYEAFNVQTFTSVWSATPGWDGGRRASRRRSRRPGE